MKEAWWVDYMEGEMPAERNEDMQMVLRFSQADREILKNLRKTREKIKESNIIEMPNDNYFDELQAKIMVKVRKASMEVPNKPSPKAALKKILRKAIEGNNKKIKTAQYYFSMGN